MFITYKKLLNLKIFNIYKKIVYISVEKLDLKHEKRKKGLYYLIIKTEIGNPFRCNLKQINLFDYKTD